mgnify:FL=1
MPVICVIVPSTALGACLLMSNRPGWDAVSKLVTLIALGAQLGVSIGFAAVIERAATVHADAIAALPMDDEVAALDEQLRQREEAWRLASNWRRDGYPRAAMVVAVAAAVVGASVCHLTVLVRCFESVTVADRFDGPPLHGSALRVVRGVPGWLVVSGFVLCALLVWGHRTWVAREARRWDVLRG